MGVEQTSHAEFEEGAQLVAEPAVRSGMSEEERRYMQGDLSPATSSVLISNSKYLNNPYYRDAWAQIGLRRHGRDLPPTYDIPILAKALAEVTDYQDFGHRIEVEKKKNPEFAEWLAARRYTAWQREAFEGCAAGTLGHALWEFLGAEGVEIELQSKGVAITNDIDYIFKRRAGTHDILHLVTGYGPNSAGEQALAMSEITVSASYFSPELAQHITSGLSFLTSASLNRAALHYPAYLPMQLKAQWLGIGLGHALKRPLMMEPWEDMVDWQLDDIARHLNFERGPGKEWDWTTDAATG